MEHCTVIHTTVNHILFTEGGTRKLLKIESFLNYEKHRCLIFNFYSMTALELKTKDFLSKIAALSKYFHPDYYDDTHLAQDITKFVLVLKYIYEYESGNLTKYNWSLNMQAYTNGLDSEFVSKF